MSGFWLVTDMVTGAERLTPREVQCLTDLLEKELEVRADHEDGPALARLLDKLGGRGWEEAEAMWAQLKADE